MGISTHLSCRSAIFKVCRLAAVCSVVFAFSVQATVQGQVDLTALSIEQLLNVEVSSASKFTQKITEAPASVSIVTAADIKDNGYRTLADILRSVRGFYVSYDRNYSYAGTRGFNRPGDYNDRILLMIDGYRTNDAVYDSASIGTDFPLNIDLIERVEIVRGPGSSIYGSNAVFGVVNVITRRGRDYNGWQASGEAASFGADKESLIYGRRYDNGAEMLLSGNVYNSRGQNLFFPAFNTPATNNGIAQGLDSDKARRVYGKLSFDDFIFSALHSERIKGIPTASFGTVFNDPRSLSKDVQTALNLSYNSTLSAQHDVTARMYYNRYAYQGAYPWSQPPVTVNLDRSQGEWWGADVKLVSRYASHKVVTGVEYQDNLRQDQKNYDVNPYLLYQDDKRKSYRNAIYVQDEITLRDDLIFNAGMRRDHYSTVGNTINPRLALIYNPLPETTVKLLYGTAFRAPNAYELYYTSTTMKPSQNLKPEQITSNEFVLEQQFGPNLRLNTSFYYNQISNLISQVIDPADGLLVFVNADQTSAKGAEFELERAWENNSRLRASYAWQLSRVQGSGMELVNSPRHLAKLNYSIPLLDDAVHCGTELQYTGSRKTLAGGYAGGYAVVNLTLLSQKLGHGMEISASVYNLLDRRYVDPARPEHRQDVILQDGRNFRVKLSYLL